MDVEHSMSSRGSEGRWWLNAESVRSIDDGITVIFVGKGLVGLEGVLEDLYRR